MLIAVAVTLAIIGVTPPARSAAGSAVEGVLHHLGIGDGATADQRGLTQPMRQAFRRARRAAARDGVALSLTSGWRSAEHQQRLYDEALESYRSAAEARKWVLPPDESSHVTGEAIDVGPGPVERTWLEENGSRWGLCRRYANETWHFEIRTSPGMLCPALESHA
ncbi:hypothetical protein BH09ACT12_BH09ACT12_28850 [soil metagenome]